MIEQVYRVADLKQESTPTLQKALEHIHANAVGVTYLEGTAEPTTTQVPFGAMCIWDSGAAKRLYLRTGKDTIGYVVLT
jgi:hypothetical protein